MTGKVALVTGGSSGIGRAAALRFARAGARVVVTGRNAERGGAVVDEIRRDGGDAKFVRADVADAGDVAALVDKTVAAYGRLDCAVNNAAQTGELRPTADCTEEDFDALVAVNLKSVWRCLTHEIRQMLRQSPPVVPSSTRRRSTGSAAHHRVLCMQ